MSFEDPDVSVSVWQRCLEGGQIRTLQRQFVNLGFVSLRRHIDSILKYLTD